MKQDTAVTLTVIPSGKCCRLCGRKEPFSSFLWTDSAGNSGVSPRCEACRTRGKRDKPGMPKLRYRCTRHAVVRYMERCRPHLLALPPGKGHMQGRLEMRYLMAEAPWHPRWPSWVDMGEDGASEPAGHLAVTPDILFALVRPRGRSVVDRCIVTVITRRATMGGTDLEDLRLLLLDMP